MIDLPYSLIIEATEEPDYFGFYSPDLAGFSGIGHSIEDCVYKARWGMKEHVKILQDEEMTVPSQSVYPRIIVQNQPKPEPISREYKPVLNLRQAESTAPAYP